MPPKPPDPSLRLGQMLGGKYRLESVLGQGGMGAVYLAENVDIGRKVAIKILHPDFADDPDMLARFRNEARAAAAIGHPGIVEVLDLGMTDDGGAFIVMECLSGETLGARLARVGSVAPDAAVWIMGEVLDTVGAAHDKGVTHRDLKPDNIFLVEQPTPSVKVLDFGISKFKSKNDDISLTRTGIVLGTPHYMSPEQARGARDVGPSADLYAIGAILYEALAGFPPFRGDSYNEVIAKVLTEAHQPIREIRPDIPEELARVVDCLLQKNPKERPADARAARELLAGVDVVLSGPAGPESATVRAPWSRPETPPVVSGAFAATQISPSQRRKRAGPSTAELIAATQGRRNLRGWIAGGIALALVGGAAFAYVRYRRDQRHLADLEAIDDLAVVEEDPSATGAASGADGGRTVRRVRKGAQAATTAPAPGAADAGGASQAIEASAAAADAGAQAAQPPVVAQRDPVATGRIVESQVSARETQIEVTLVAEPPHAQWKVDGKLLSCRGRCRVAKRKGTSHVVVALAPGFSESSTELVFDRPGEVKVELSPAARPPGREPKRRPERRNSWSDWPDEDPRGKHSELDTSNPFR